MNTSFLLDSGGVFLLSYLIGSIPFGLLIGKWNGIDVRTAGSCNIGATNVTRILGKKWGIPCFFLDALKGYLPVWITIQFLCPHAHSDWTVYLPACSAIAAVVGHIFPIWLKFRGGKGVSTIIGVILAISPLAMLTSLFVWLLFFLAFRYVSLASIALAVTLPLADWMLGIVGFQLPNLPNTFLLIVLAVLTLFKHRTNLSRLIHGTENRFTRSKPEVQHG